MDLEECLNFSLTKAQQHVYQAFKAELSEYNVTPVQYALLRCLWDKDGQTSKNLANRLSLDYSTMTTHLDRMETKGLILKTTDPNDRRALQILLTDKGRSLEAPVTEAIIRANDKFLAKIDKDKWETFRSFLLELSEA